MFFVLFLKFFYFIIFYCGNRVNQKRKKSFDEFIMNSTILLYLYFVIIVFLHISHSYITHSFLLKREEPPTCSRVIND